jgi:acyl carrier protein
MYTSSEIFEDIKKLIVKVTGYSGEITRDSKFQDDLGIDPVQLAKVVTLSEKIHFYVSEHNDFVKLKTVQNLVALAEEKQPKKTAETNEIPNIPVPDSQIA